MFAFYLVLLVWAPIPLGSNRAWSAAILEISVFMLAGAWLLGFLGNKYRPGPVFAKSVPIVCVGVAWLCLVWLQLMPLPLGLLKLVSPEAAHWHEQASISRDLAFASLTLDRHATLEGALKSSAYIAFFALGLILLQAGDRVRITTYALILSGTLQALYGTLASFQSPDGMAAGTFVNRNHFASYMVMCLSIGIGVLIGSLSGERTHSWGQFLKGMVQWVITPKMGLRLLLVAMVIALVLTRSRMGNVSFFIAMLCAGLIGLALSRKATRSTVVMLVSLVVIDVLIVGTYFGTQKVIDRIAQTSAQSEDRGDLAGYALSMWKDYPVFGAGLGSFATVFPRYSGEGTPYSYTHAHNDYLEFAAETGILGVSMLGLMAALSFAAALRAQQVRRDPVMRGVSFACVMGIIAMMIHSGVDFSLQIPANALTFIQLLAFGWISLHARSDET